MAPLTDDSQYSTQDVTAGYVGAVSEQVSQLSLARLVLDLRQPVRPALFVSGRAIAKLNKNRAVLVNHFRTLLFEIVHI